VRHKRQHIHLYEYLVRLVQLLMSCKYVPVGHFLLTDLLLEKINITAKERGIEGRIVIVASDSYKNTYREGIQCDKLNGESGYLFLIQTIFSFVYVSTFYKI
jgi:hypothetical protein